MYLLLVYYWLRWYCFLNMTVNPILMFLCLFVCSLSVLQLMRILSELMMLNDDACHNVRRVNHSFLNKQKTVINEQMITKQLQYKVSISTELADWWCDGWFNDLVKILLYPKVGHQKFLRFMSVYFKIEIIIKFQYCFMKGWICEFGLKILIDL